MDSISGSIFATGYVINAAVRESFVCRFALNGTMEWQLIFGPSQQSSETVDIVFDDIDGSVIVAGWTLGHIGERTGAITVLASSSCENMTCQLLEREGFTMRISGEGDTISAVQFGTAEEHGWVNPSAISLSPTKNYLYITGTAEGNLIDAMPGIEQRDSINGYHDQAYDNAVSYTHLTLPTIYSV